jgi:hypothetical protein
VVFKFPFERLHPPEEYDPHNHEEDGHGHGADNEPTMHRPPKFAAKVEFSLFTKKKKKQNPVDLAYF